MSPPKPSRLARHLKSRKKFWQIKTATENRPDCEFRALSGYDDLEIIPQHFHDDTPKDAVYPVITDDQKTFSIEEDALHGTAAEQGSRYRLRLKDTELDCQALADLRATTNKQGAVAASNYFEQVLKTFHELRPKVLQSRERMEQIMADSPANEFSRAYREGYLDSEQGESAHDQACQYAVEHCLRHGATEQQVMLFVEKQAPMSVWEDTSVYAMRILREARQDLASRGLRQFIHENREGHRR